MSDRINHGSRPWKAVPREVLRDKRLSAQAKGGLCTLLSHEEGWVRSVIAILMKENRACGRKQAKAIMRELCEVGYAELAQSRSDAGRFSTGYAVFPESSSERSTSLSPGSVSGGPVRRGPVKGAAVVEPPDVEPQEVEPLEHLAPKRARNPLVDALADATGLDPYGMTAEEAEACGVALASIRRASPEVTSEELHRRAANYQTHFTVPLTPNALKRHWSKCREPATAVKPYDHAAAIARGERRLA